MVLLVLNILMNSQKCKCTSKKNPLFFRPFGAVYGCYSIVQRLHLWLYPFCPSGMTERITCGDNKLFASAPPTFSPTGECDCYAFSKAHSSANDFINASSLRYIVYLLIFISFNSFINLALTFLLILISSSTCSLLSLSITLLKVINFHTESYTIGITY